MKPFTMDLHSMISCIPISTSRFPRNVTVFKIIVIICFIISLVHYEIGKNKWQYANRRPNHEDILRNKIFWLILALPPKKISPVYL